MVTNKGIGMALEGVEQFHENLDMPQDPRDR
jgi:hypothetical protein